MIPSAKFLAATQKDRRSREARHIIASQLLPTVPGENSLWDCTQFWIIETKPLRVLFKKCQQRKNRVFNNNFE